MRSFIRVNHKIRVPQVRLINADGAMLGVVSTRDARIRAEGLGLDLVEISPNADPPVCKIMDFGKFRYDESRKEKEARKHQHSHVVKEIKFHPNVADHDYDTKLNHVKDFLGKGHRVKISLTFRGRENAHKELGVQLVSRVLQDCQNLGVPEMTPRIMGRSVLAVIAPRTQKQMQSQSQPAPQQSVKPATVPVSGPVSVPVAQTVGPA